MSEELKVANGDESDVKDSSWEEAIRTELLDKIKEEVNQTLDKGLGAILTTLDTKMETIISLKLSTTVVQKNDETITRLETSINDVAKLRGQNATRIVELNTEFTTFSLKANQEILVSLVELVKDQMQEGIEEIRGKLVEYKDQTEKYRETVKTLTDTVTDLNSQ